MKTKPSEASDRVAETPQAGRSRAVPLLSYLNRDGFFRMFFESVPFGIVLGGPKGRIERANPAFCHMLGYTEDEMRGKSSTDFTHTDDVARTEVLRQNMEVGRAVTYTKKFLHKNGSVVLSRITNSVIKSKDGNILYSLAIIEDVTRQNELVHVQSQLASIVESSSDAVFSLTLDGLIQTWNSGAQKVYGFTAKEAMSKEATFLAPQAAECRAFQDALDWARNGKSRLNVETIHVRNDGTAIPVAMTVSPIKNEFDQVEGISVISRDMTNFKQTLDALHCSEQQMRITGESLRRTNQELERFAFIASHDLQEPLRSISCFLQLLEKRNTGNLDRSSEEFLHFAVDGSKRLQQMIMDLLQFSRTARYSGEKKPVPLGKQLEDALFNLRSAMDENNVDLVSDPLPTVLSYDNQFTQVFQNLVSNAIKFRTAEAPHIQISCGRHEEGWIIRVKDNGIGFVSEHAERIFDIFQRLHTREEYPGTGVGLAICKKVVELHGGRIWAEASEGGGAIFSFTLPIFPEAAELVGERYVWRGIKLP